MAYYEMMPAGLPAGLQSGMDSVLNKKFGTATSYAPGTWPDTVNLMGPLPEGTATGSIAHIEDGADEVPLKSWEVEIAPTLTGKSAIECTQAGKNLFDNTSLFPASGSVSSYYFKQFDYNSNLIPLIKLQAGVTYTFSLDITSTIEPFNFSVGCGNGSYSNDILTVYNKSNGRISITFTPTAEKLNNGDIFAFMCPRYQAQNTFDYSISNVQLEFGSTATSYEPYTAPTVSTVNLGRTIYGGTAGVVKGTGTETYANTSLTDKNYYYSSTLQRFDCTLDGVISSGYMDDFIPPQGYTIDHALIINASDAPDYTMCIYGGKLYIKNLSCSSVPELVSDMSGKYLTYSLATPTDFTFTPITPTPETALGVNNFWADEGDSEVTYRADINLALQALSGSRGLMMARPQLEPETEPEETIEETPEEMER